MKKNTMMRIASFLLIAVLLSTSAISGTYAKYVTQGTGTDNARVAKFGVVVTADSDIFDAEYKADDTSYTLGEMTVDAEVNVVAPGTTKTMAKVGITGTPEVAVRISNKVEKFEIGDYWMVDANNNDVNSSDYVRDTFYCPIIITVIDAKGETHNISGLDYTSADEFEGEVVKAINTATKDYAPNTDLSTLENWQILEVKWQWEFEGSTDSAALSYGQKDIYDTQLGDVAAFLTAPTIEISVTTTVTQID